MLASEEAVDSASRADLLLLMLGVGGNHVLVHADGLLGRPRNFELAPGLHEIPEALREPLANAVQVSNLLAL